MSVTFKRSILAILTPLIIVGGIVSGVFTQAFELHGQRYGVTTATDNDIYLIKFGSSGSPTWVRTFGIEGHALTPEFLLDFPR